jgi:thiol-disulfide isomerase/thioredoxin
MPMPPADALRRRHWLRLALAAGAAAGAPAAWGAAATDAPAETGADLRLPAADGRLLQLSSLPARAVWLDFWASWCAPCRLSFPWMAELQQRHAAQGLAVVAVNLDKRASDAQAFLRGRDLPFALLFDPAGESARQYAVGAMPTSLLLEGRTLRVLLRHAGFRRSDTPVLEAAVAAALRA